MKRSPENELQLKTATRVYFREQTGRLLWRNVEKWCIHDNVALKVGI